MMQDVLLWLTGGVLSVLLPLVVVSRTCPDRYESIRDSETTLY